MDCPADTSDGEIEMKKMINEQWLLIELKRNRRTETDLESWGTKIPLVNVKSDTWWLEYPQTDIQRYKI